MHPAGEALLDEDLVHAVLQRALGRMFLQALQEAEVAERTSQQNLLTTPAPSTASVDVILLSYSNTEIVRASSSSLAFTCLLQARLRYLWLRGQLPVALCS
eukprot:m.584923 g.584923  ORF g.584923 m.584923 type:complete len:101 (-) comp57966_c0_seq2:1730-2032(-)